MKMSRRSLRRRGSPRKFLRLLVLLALGASACTSLRLAPARSPYEQYAERLASSGLADAALTRDWVAAGEVALAHPMDVDAPFSETGYFAPETPSATAYALQLSRGRELAVDVEFHSIDPARLFIDLFRRTPEKGVERVASMAEDSARLEYEVDRGGTYLLRVQPELLRGGRFTLVQRTLATLALPVEGVDQGALQSVFGALRDAGRRTHEGVDIFAPRGTPALAVVDGVARADTNRLGGKVVWLRAAFGGPTFYYAHLDRWAFDGSARVRRGDVVGFVGNTGNARTTSPHLHFGIYDRHAIDPGPFLRADDQSPETPLETSLLGERARTRASRTELKRGTGAEAARVATMEQGTPVTVVGRTRAMVRVVAPTGMTGYLAANAVTSARTPLGREVSPGRHALHERPDATSPVVRYVEPGTSVEIVGRYADYSLVRTPDGTTAWRAPVPAGT
jgi:murein DD-endopeptidase MepM/ murein hydrolase activator NlpD/SH3-like domain-containing protein